MVWWKELALLGGLGRALALVLARHICLYLVSTLLNYAPAALLGLVGLFSILRLSFFGFFSVSSERILQ